MDSVVVTLSADILVPAGLTAEQAGEIARSLQFHLDWAGFLAANPTLKLDGITIEDVERYDEEGEFIG